MKEILFGAAVAVLIAASLLWAIDTENECDERGGVLVKGYSGLLVCVAAPPKGHP